MHTTGSRSPYRILAVLFVGVLMGALDIAIVGPALPAIQDSFHAGDRSIAWIFTIYVLFNLVGTPLMAKLSDALGRRLIYVIDVALFALGSLLVVLSPSFGMLLAGRAIQGLGAGGIFPVASAVIGDIFPPEKRGRALGLIGAVFGLAFLIGPILGGILLTFSWHWLFLINIPIALGIIAAAIRLLPEAQHSTRKRFDLLGMIVMGVLLASMAYGLNQIDSSRFLESLLSLDVWPFLLVAVLLLPVFWMVERRAKDPILRPSFFTSRQVALAAAFATGAGIGEAAVVFVPKLLTISFGVSESTASFMLIPIILAMAFGSPLAGRMLDKVGSRLVVIAGFVFLAAGMLLTGFFNGDLVRFYIAAVLVGLGLSILLGAPLRYIMLGEASANERASAQGALTLFTSTGQLVGGALVGALIASHGGGIAAYENAYFTIGIIAVVLIALAFGLKGRAAEMQTITGNAAMESASRQG